MTLKRYQQIRIISVIVLAFIFSQTIVFRNFFLAIPVLLVGSLFLWYCRSRVVEIIADERDYEVGGKAASLAIQIYAWIATIIMFLLYTFAYLNPTYEPAALTLAYSTCLLMLLYAVIFRYYHRVKLTDKKFVFAVVVFVLFVLVGLFSLRLFSGEDDWLCQNGQWIKHGQPDFPMPSVKCQ